MVLSQTSGLCRVMLATLGGAPAGFACVSEAFFSYRMILYFVNVASCLDLDGAVPQALGAVTGMACRMVGKALEARKRRAARVGLPSCHRGALPSQQPQSLTRAHDKSVGSGW